MIIALVTSVMRDGVNPREENMPICVSYKRLSELKKTLKRGMERNEGYFHWDIVLTYGEADELFSAILELCRCRKRLAGLKVK